MSQYIPSAAVSSDTPITADGSAAHAGSPDWRSATLDNRASQPMRPLRCAAITTAISAVTTSAPTVAPIASAAAAPPAGSLPLACASRVTPRICLSSRVRPHLD